MNIKYIALSLAAATALSATAQDELISGYFRVKNGNGNYLAVTGPFTANANLSLNEAERRAGSIFRISGYQDGNAYRLTNLGAQGIDLAEEKFDPSSTENGLTDLILGLENEGVVNAGDMLYGMAQQGYRYGYTSIARATLATLFSYVAGRLEDHASGVDGYTKNEFNNVTKRFSKEVLEDLDLGLRMVPSKDDPYTMTIYTDMPDFGKVADWYTDTSDADKQARHDSFYRATLAMMQWLGGGIEHPETGEEMMVLWPEAVSLIKDWGFDIAANYPDYAITDLGPYADKVKFEVSETNPAMFFTFDQVFSDGNYLFNWLKFMMYTMLNPETDKYNVFDKLQGYLGNHDLNKIMREHTITRLMLDQLPYFQVNSRIYFIAGNVVEGTYNPEEYHLGFAVDNSALETAAEKGTWTLEPVDENTRITVSLGNSLNMMNYGAFVFDFPVIADEAQLYSLSDEMTVTDPAGLEHTYVELVAEEAFDAAVPFIIGSVKATADLKINAESVIKPLEAEKVYVKFEISDEEVTKQYAPRGPQKTVAATNGQLRGTLLPTSTENLKQYWALDSAPVVYNFGQQTSATGVTAEGKAWQQTSDHNGFNLTSSATKANEAVYVPSEAKSYDRVLISQPEFTVDTATSIREIAIESAGEELYTLQGVRVNKPVAGNIYLSRKGNTVSKVIVR